MSSPHTAPTAAAEPAPPGLHRAVTDWFDDAARDLPWRTPSASAKIRLTTTDPYDQPSFVEQDLASGATTLVNRIPYATHFPSGEMAEASMVRHLV